MSLLTIDSLVKTFGDFALGPISLQVDEGSSVGLIGANGAGKTTLFRTIMGTLRHQQGSIAISGSEITAEESSWKNQVGYVGDYTPLFDNWTGYKNFSAYKRFYSNWSSSLATELAKKLNLDLNKKVKTYSTGQRTKFAITLALAHQPRLLILDEPTSGLDPVSRDVFMEVLFEFLSNESVALMYATHHIAEIEQLADRLIFVSEGQLVCDEVKEDLAQNWRRVTYRSEYPPANIPNVISQKGEHPYYEFITDDGDTAMKFLAEAGATSIEGSRLSIEKIAVEILKSSAKEFKHV